MLHYNHQKEVRPDLLKVAKTHHRKGKVCIMKKIMMKVNEFFEEYYKSFADKF